MINNFKFSEVRPPAVAGTFYPRSPNELSDSIQHYLDTAEKIFGPADSAPKAIIAPHAGYIYSGLTASAVYQRLRPARNIIERVIIFGPCHRVAVKGIALPNTAVFNTPLGDVKLDTSVVKELSHFPIVQINNETHIDDHSIEVHLPFLQTLLNNFSIVPLIVGEADPEHIAEILDYLWGGEETLIIISSDLSHYLDYVEAKNLDNQTRKAIEEMNTDIIGPEQACGRHAIKGLLTVAKQKGLSVKTADMRNSGDTAGGKIKVVGYGAWYFEERPKDGINKKEALSRNFDNIIELNQVTLLKMAASAIMKKLSPTPLQINDQYKCHEKFEKLGASFVTLSIGGRLRGCIGSLQAWQPLIKDIIENASKAAFEDPRFEKLTLEEIQTQNVDLSISILSEHKEINFSNEIDLCNRIRQYEDGVILSEGNLHRGVFLPVVWEKISDPKDFIRELKLKAGLSKHYWSESIRAWRFSTKIISSLDCSTEQIWDL